MYSTLNKNNLDISFAILVLKLLSVYRGGALNMPNMHLRLTLLHGQLVCLMVAYALLPPSRQLRINVNVGVNGILIGSIEWT